MAAKKRLGELLIQQKIVSQEIISEALQVQVGGNRRLGNILVNMSAITEDQLAEILSEQLNIPLTDISATFTPEVKKLLPRYLCTKYGALPLALKNNNVLLTAMSDPSDNSAITDIEHYTNKVVEPCLAKQSDIGMAVKSKIPYSFKDTFNPQTNTRITRVVAIAALLMVFTLGVTTFNYIKKVRYGTVSQLATSTLYKHHDLMVGFDTSGKISLLGHGAFADGYYSVSFTSLNNLKAFIESRKDDLSVPQNEWLQWVLEKEGSFKSPETGIAESSH